MTSPPPEPPAATLAAPSGYRRFTSVMDLPAGTSPRLPRLLADAGIAGGAAYDALVALTALRHGAVLVTRDRRARDTYQRVGVPVVTV